MSGESQYETFPMLQKLSKELQEKQRISNQTSAYLSSGGTGLLGDELAASTGNIGGGTGLDKLNGQFLIERSNGTTSADVEGAALGDKSRLRGSVSDGKEGKEESEDLHDDCFGMVRVCRCSCGRWILMSQS